MFQLHLNGTLTETGVAEQLSHETRSENKSKVHSFAELKYLPAFDMVKSLCWILWTSMMHVIAICGYDVNIVILIIQNGAENTDARQKT